jgi:hypothetical protein
VKWNVRAVDLVAGVAMVGILGAGGILALGAYDDGTADPPSAPAADYSAGTIPADEFGSDGTDDGTGKPPGAGKEGGSGKGASGSGQQPDGAGPGTGSPIVFPGDPVPPEPVAQPVEFVISSFNILGSSHTTGERPRFASGPTRARAVGQLLLAHKVEIVGFQELQNNQRSVIESMVGDRYAMFPGASMSERESVNSIAWDMDRWEAVDSRVVDIPYFHGSIRQMPVVKLQNRSNDAQVWVGNFHNPSDADGMNEQWRQRATAIEIQLANELLENDQVPVLFTGDFNEREDVFCPMVAQTPLTSANGGTSENGVCRPPSPTYIDWVFGAGVEWLSQIADKGALVRRTTDHPMIVVHALLQPPEGSAAAQEAADALSRTEKAEKP